MKITNNRINVTKIYNDNKPAAVHEKEKQNSRYDTLEISKEGQEIAKYAAMAKGSPDIRADKVQEIKNRIQSGKYNVSSEDIASKIVQTIKGENI